MSTKNRQNEYFVPRDGIDREVITADVCRYLGNDALVRPGTYEDPSTGQTIQGYFINAYRNLTSAMIEDLKADSARWEQERRQQSARTTAGVQYRNSQTHNSRQHHGPTSDSGPSGYVQDNSRDPYGDGDRRYPGTGSGGYSGASGFSQYPPQNSGYGGQYSHPPTSQSPQYTGQSSAYGNSIPPGAYAPPPGQGPYIVGGNNSVREPDAPMFGSDSYRGGPVTTIPSSRPGFPAVSPSAPVGYGSATYQQQQPMYGQTQNTDVFYGRGGVPYDNYDATPAPSRTPTGPTGTSVPPSSSSRRSDTHRTHGARR